MHTRSGPLRRALLLLALFVCSLSSALAAAPPDGSMPVPPEIEQAKDLLENGMYVQAAEVLEGFISSGDVTDADLRYAYNTLVFIRLQAMQAGEARVVAEEALRRYPDISADQEEFPVTVNDTYEEVRARLFGSLAVTKPEGAQVYLDDSYVGTAPLMLEYVPAGQHQIYMTMDDRSDYSSPVEIDPGETLRIEPSMSKSRGFGWWAVRVAPVVLVGTAVAIAASGDDGGSSGSEVTSLPDPPDPP